MSERDDALEMLFEIDSQGMKPVERLRQSVVTRIEDLEQRCGRMTTCRVVLKAPRGNHREGLYEVNVQLALPHGWRSTLRRTSTV